MDFKNDILSKINIVSYYSKHLEWTYKHGKNWKAKCPFHSESDGSFCVEISTGFYKCFGCEESGDVISFEQRITNQDFNQSIKSLAAYAGVDLKSAKTKTTKKSKSKRKSNKPKLDENTCNALHKNLTPVTRKYLNSRGISNSVIDVLQLGSWGDFVVFPIRKDGKLYNYRFKSIKEKGRVWHLTEEDLGHHPLWVFPEPNKSIKEVILLEGEIDALTAVELGLNATTITGGAGSFSEDLLGYFKDKNVYICYDIDQAGRLGAKKVARRIASVAASSKIVHLDISEESYPGGDFNDYVLKAEKGIADFRKLMKNAEPVVEVPEDIEVVEDDGCYWKLKSTKKGTIKTERISNFTVRLECRYRSHENTITREISLVRSGKTSGKRILEAKFMSTARTFREFCLSSGDYIWEGSEKDLGGIWQLVIAQDPTSREVRSEFGVGFCSNLGVWLFENVTIKSGTVLLPDENGICWNGNCGYSYQPLEVAGMDLHQPTPKLNITDESTYDLMKEFSENLYNNVGTIDALYGLALTCGSVYFDDIINHFGCYPILWIYGQMQCGKNEFAGFLMRMYGLGRADNESLPGVRSTVPITRRLSYYGNVPVWFDEFRNSNKNNDMIKGVFRSAYNASGRSLGLKATKGVVKERTKAPVIISGEQLPEDDEALLSRLIIIHLKLAGRRDDLYSKVFDLSQQASAHIFNLIKNKTKESAKILINEIEKAKKDIALNNSQLNSRIILNHAIVLGCYNYLVDKSDVLLRDYLISGMALDGRREAENEDTGGGSIFLNEFIDKVSVILVERQLSGVGWFKVNHFENEIAIWLSPIYKEWAESEKRMTGTNPPSRKTILDHFKVTDYYIKHNKSCRIDIPNSIKSNNRKCIFLKINKLPDNIKSWFSEEEFEQISFTNQ